MKGSRSASSLNRWNHGCTWLTRWDTKKTRSTPGWRRRSAYWTHDITGCLGPDPGRIGGGDIVDDGIDPDHGGAPQFLYVPGQFRGGPFPGGRLDPGHDPDRKSVV